jgi:hypothetical protein
VLVAGTDIGGSQPWVTVVDPATGAILNRFLAYEAGFKGGVRVALGDVTGNGVDEILTGPGPGREGEIRVFRRDGTELVAYRTLPFGAGYRGGVEVATGDVNGDDVDDMVAGASRGPGLVSVFFVNPAAADPVANVPDRAVQTMPSDFIGGVSVATADVGTFVGGAAIAPATPDGRFEVVIGSGAGGGPPQVLIYDMSGVPTVIRRISPFSPGFLGGVSVSAGRYDGDGIHDIIVAAGRRGGSQIEVHSGRASGGVLARQAAFAALATANLPTYATGLDADGDGRIDSLAASQGAGSGVGIRRVGASLAAATLSPLGGPLRIVATRAAIR